MSSFDGNFGRNLIAGMIQDEGHFSDDPRAYSIWAYKNQFGGDVAWYVAYTLEAEKAIADSAMKNPVLLWRRDKGTTTAGVSFLHETQEILQDLRDSNRI